MIGITPTLAYVQKYCADAQATPGLQGEFETKMYNRWLHSATNWLSVAAWDRCADAGISLETFAGERAYIGVDLAERDDIAAVAIAFRRGDHIHVFVKGYLPELVVNERSRVVPEYTTWVRSGELVTTPGNLTDYHVIEADIRQLCPYDVAAIVIERFGALNLASNLLVAGLPARIESKNAKVFTAPAKELEARVRAGQMRHTGSSFLRWQISNVCCERRRDGRLLPTKESATSPNKIDAVDAILLGMSAMLDAPAVVTSIYDRESISHPNSWCSEEPLRMSRHETITIPEPSTRHGQRGSVARGTRSPGVLDDPVHVSSGGLLRQPSRHCRRAGRLPHGVRRVGVRLRGVDDRLGHRLTAGRSS